MIFNFPGTSAAINTVSELCGVEIRQRRGTRNASTLSLKQHFPKPFPKKFGHLICAEDC